MCGLKLVRCRLLECWTLQVRGRVDGQLDMLFVGGGGFVELAVVGVSGDSLLMG
jgi:hypothetical protein